MSWKNVPIPQTIVIPLGVGIIIEIFFSRRLFPATIVWLILALLFLLFGLALMFWSIREAGKRDMISPVTLITGGPYTFSRNPMYVSWLAIFLSVFFFSRSLWLLLLFFAAFLLTHFAAVLPEERALREKFADEFVAYRARVRRYI